MAKYGLEAKVGARLEMMTGFRQERSISEVQKNYLVAFEKLNKILDLAIKEAENNPEAGIAVARRCSRSMMESMPDLALEPARANSLRQYDALEESLALVRQPGQYLARMQKQFGSKLDPRQHRGNDTFNINIKSLRRHLYDEGIGLNTQQEKNFARKRSELLGAVEKTYNRLRDQALGVTAPEHQKGRGR
jgi:hypothetical protein